MYNGWTNFETWLVSLYLDNWSYGKYNNVTYIANKIIETSVFKNKEDFKKFCINELIKCDEYKLETDFNNIIEKANWDEIIYYYTTGLEDDVKIIFIETAQELLKYFVPDNDKILFPNFQIDKDFYTECKTIIESNGYKYINKKQGFKKIGGNAQEDLEKMINGVDISSARKQFDFYPTPNDVVQKAQILLEHNGIDFILEPSAGTGNLVTGLEKYTKAIELNPECINALKEKQIEIIGSDFINETPQLFNYIIMNPPFSKRQDAKHVCLAFDKWLNNNGILVAITGTGILSASDKFSKAFQDLYNKYGVYQEILNNGAFKESGTNVNTVITKFIKK